jgi:hypothetical protein
MSVGNEQMSTRCAVSAIGAPQIRVTGRRCGRQAHAVACKLRCSSASNAGVTKSQPGLQEEKLMRLFVVGLVGALLTVALGCNTSDRGGGAEARTSFKLSAPALPTSIKQGDRETVKLNVDRGKDFKQDVQLRATAPKGISVDLAKKDVKAAEPSDVGVTITVDKDAPLGEHVVTVTGTPKDGSPATVDFKVVVKEGGKT